MALILKSDPNILEMFFRQKMKFLGRSIQKLKAHSKHQQMWLNALFCSLTFTVVRGLAASWTILLHCERSCIGLTASTQCYSSFTLLFIHVMRKHWHEHWCRCTLGRVWAPQVFSAIVNWWLLIERKGNDPYFVLPTHSQNWLSRVSTDVDAVDEHILYGSCSLQISESNCNTHVPTHLFSATTVVWAHWLVQKHGILIWFRLCSSSVGQNCNCWAEICDRLRWWEKISRGK